MTITSETIKAYALENAQKYGGKANQGAVLAGLFSEGLEKSKIKDFMPQIQEVIKEINNLTPEEQEKQFKTLKKKTSKREIREGLPELPNAKEGQVVMRFAPFPSGPLHIGHARQLVLNDEYVKKYGGKLLLVMDDTIGSENKPLIVDAYKLIEDGTKWIKANYEKEVIYKSNRIETYYEYAEDLIKKGYIYICDCDKEIIRTNKEKKIECSCRDLYFKEQEKRWKSMFTAEEGTYCARLKTDMQDPDPAFRDRIMFRISDRPHAKLKTKYRVYPLLDFSWAIDDHLLGITHIIRGMDLMMETKVEKFIWDIYNWNHPETIHTGFFQIEGVKISKSKGAKEVLRKEYIGWNDPRLWSFQSLEDRGILSEAIRGFIIGQGLRRSNTTVPIDILYSLNKKLIENSKRYLFVKNPQNIKINGCPQLTTKIKHHPALDLGEREYTTNQEFLIDENDYDQITAQNYRLMHLLNFKAIQINTLRPTEFSFISTDPSPDLKSKLIHWLPRDTNNIDVTIMMPDGKTIIGKGEEALRQLKEKETIQFERFGFVKLYKKNKDKLEFFFTQK
jgi:glutamyl-tRNA synthetase